MKPDMPDLTVELAQRRQRRQEALDALPPEIALALATAEKRFQEGGKTEADLLAIMNQALSEHPGDAEAIRIYCDWWVLQP